MRKVPYPAEYKAWSNKNIRHFDVRVQFNGKTLTTKDIAAIKIQSELMTEDTFAIGSSVTETLDFSFYIDTVFGANALSNDNLIDIDTPIIPYVSLCTIVDIKTDEGFIPTEVWQEVCMGIYYLNPDFMYVEGTNVMDIRASSMLGHGKYGDRIYEEDYYKDDEDAMFSQPLISIITEICNDLGLTLSTTSGDFPNVIIADKEIIKEDESEDDDTGTGDDTGNTGGTTGGTVDDSGCCTGGSSSGTPNVDTDGDGTPDKHVEKEIIRNCVVGKTYKEIIEYAALLYGGHARVVYKEVNGAKTKVLEFFKLELQSTPFYTYDESNCSLFKRGTEKLKINKFECAVDRDEVLTAGSDGVDGAKTIYLECQDMTQERLNAIFSEYSGYSYYPITAKIFGSPVLEVGDRILIKGPKSGTNREMPLQSITYNITGNGLTMDIQSKYAINKRKRETIKDAISDIDDQLDNLRDELDDLRDSTGGCFCDCEERLTALENKPDGGCDCDLDPILNRITELEKRKECTCEPGSGEGLGGNPITFYNDPRTLYDGNTYAGTIGSIDALDGYNKDCDGLEVRGEDVLALGVTNGTCMYMLIDNTKRTLLDADFHTNGHTIYVDGDGDNTINIGNGTLFGNSSDYGQISYMELYYCRLASNLNCKNFELTNVKNSTYTSAQSDHTSSLIDSGTNEHIMHGSWSYYDGELRWCWKETVFTYPECDIDPETDEWIYTGRNICYIEIPIFMAENIQNDYHINVSKMSWGDYRIIEKNPYYFILESQEEDFAFTFEVVAKLNDNQTTNNNAIIANEGYEVLAEEYED